MNNLEFFEDLLRRCEEAHKRLPHFKVFVSIINQLKYLRDLEAGLSQDRSRLPQIILGIQAIREIEGFDDELTVLLIEADGRAREM